MAIQTLNQKMLNQVIDNILQSQNIWFSMPRFSDQRDIRIPLQIRPALDGARQGEVMLEPGVYLSGKGVE